MKTGYFACRSTSCRKTFRNESSLQKHLEEDHSDCESTSVIGYRCKKCKRVLGTKQSLKEHFYTHTGQKPYKCSEPGCGKFFRQSSQLSYHRKIHLEIKNYLQTVNESAPETIDLSTQIISLFSKPINSVNFPELPKISVPQMGIQLPNIFAKLSS